MIKPRSLFADLWSSTRAACCRSGTTSRPADAVVTFGLIAANFLVCLWELSSPGVDPLYALLSVRRQRAVPGALSDSIPSWPEGALHRCSCTRAGSTCSGTCCSSGSSATTSRTRWAVSGSCLLPRRGFVASLVQAFVTIHLPAPGGKPPEGRRERGDRRRARCVLRPPPPGRVLTLLLGFILIRIPAVCFLRSGSCSSSGRAASLTQPDAGGGSRSSPTSAASCSACHHPAPGPGRRWRRLPLPVY